MAQNEKAAFISSRAGDPPPPAVITELPKIEKKPMSINKINRTQSVLFFDDGTCESGLGAGSTAFITALVDFDVPTTCNQPGLQIVGVATRLNTGASPGVTAFSLRQSGLVPGAPSSGTRIPFATAIPASGPCPATTVGQFRAINPGVAVVNGTDNFFAGVRAAGYIARDTTGPPAGRLWLNCATCGATSYSPTQLTGLGLVLEGTGLSE